MSEDIPPFPLWSDPFVIETIQLVQNKKIAQIRYDWCVFIYCDNGDWKPLEKEWCNDHEFQISIRYFDLLYYGFIIRSEYEDRLIEYTTHDGQPEEFWSYTLSVSLKNMWRLFAHEYL